MGTRGSESGTRGSGPPPARYWSLGAGRWATLPPRCWMLDPGCWTCHGGAAGEAGSPTPRGRAPQGSEARCERQARDSASCGRAIFNNLGINLRTACRGLLGPRLLQVAPSGNTSGRGRLWGQTIDTNIKPTTAPSAGVPSLTMLGHRQGRDSAPRVPTLSRGAPAGSASGRGRLETAQNSPIERTLARRGLRAYTMGFGAPMRMVMLRSSRDGISASIGAQNHGDGSHRARIAPSVATPQQFAQRIALYTNSE